MNIWKELFHLCEAIRANSDPSDSFAVNQRQFNELERLLKLLPADDESIDGAEGGRQGRARTIKTAMHL